LIVGISFIKEKEYDCIIEEFDENKIKQTQNNDGINEENTQNQNKRKTKAFIQIKTINKYKYIIKKNVSKLKFKKGRRYRFFLS